jgi:hypothetical protein
MCCGLPLLQTWTVARQSGGVGRAAAAAAVLRMSDAPAAPAVEQASGIGREVTVSAAAVLRFPHN